MYEMYPDDWAATPQPSTTAEQPRRRARRAHSVTPSILVPDEVGQVEEPRSADQD
ncbi:hypothetical protein MLP_18060 [Microlunatus phosphovorus NM-1]|uniref:Uncharacterized protein n=1 Tax=Microlunatus phosphovorus (strain ATCC 700054 / DSM 10555 / JCM 9379 / NBRC 101784 / NCIMB 13414 / VKM Ac-1990 / NM-1) TaxID=1032480 RepID=F5XSD9_MICPN|nr:hypothetical protein [Microlunatus phosphovorus]BAK34820.1 hypothetical protein MLP_18060 [Microlunatus phosphovorus NM-1]